MKVSASTLIGWDIEQCNRAIDRLNSTIRASDSIEYFARQKTKIEYLKGQIRAYESALLYIKSDIDNGGTE